MESKKYQVSVKLEDGFIYVAHCDSREELEDEIIYFKGLVTNTAVFKATGKYSTATDAQIGHEEEKESDFEEEMDNLDPSICKFPGHGDTKMKQREGKFGPFYSHNRGKYPDLEWCSGKGFPDEREQIDPGDQYHKE